MSGGGGGGGGRDDGYQAPRQTRPAPAGGGSGSSVTDPCDIVQTAALNSPNPAVVPGLNVGDILDIILGGTPATPVLQVRTSAGTVAGSLTHRGHVDIIDCINSGNNYCAVVVERSGGLLTVRVERR